MTDDNTFELSRRKALAGLGTIGVASAGAGLGTTAFFSDEETFEDNSLTAGQLDMKVSWEEHYYDGIGDEAPYATVAGPEDDATVDFPALVPNADDIRLNVSDEGEFMGATQVQQVPEGGIEQGEEPCEVLVDGDDLSDVQIDLDDVKPGDFGEVTLDFALCDNPGYVWLTGELLADLENSVTEPEADDDDEDNVPSGDFADGDGELAETLHVLAWYDDDCDNLVDDGEEIILNTTLRDAMENYLGNGLGLPLHGDMSSLVSPGTNYIDVDGGGNAELKLESGSNPDGGGSVVHATSRGEATVDYATSMVALDSPVAIDSVSSFSYDYYQGVDHGTSGNTNKAPDEVWLLVEDGDGDRHVLFRNWNDNDAGQVWKTRDVADEIGSGSFNDSSENWQSLTGSLSNPDDLTAEFPDGEILRAGVGVGSTGTAFAADLYFDNFSVNGTSYELPTGVNQVDAGRECFDSETRYCIGFAWYLPIDHGNEVQTDSVSFDLGFYTEQCRHNDGSGQPPEQSPT